MNLTLTRRGDYALRAALYLAQDWDRDGFAKIRDVASAMSLPISYTPQVLGLLARGGLARAKAGRDGGYRLARAPGAISVLEVVEAAEGDLRSTTCILRGGPCRWDGTCAVHDAWASASESFRRSLSQTTLADLAREDLARERPARADRRVSRRGAGTASRRPRT
jgi:Rrf2 family protein